MKRLFAIALSLLAFSAVADESKQTVVFAGSSTIMPIIEDMQPIFEKNGFELQVQGGGSSAGLKSTKMGLAQIGMVSRSLTDAELKTYKHLVLAKDWLVMIAHKDNAVNNITHQEVVDIYTGKQNEWKSGEQIHVIGKEAGRATKTIFEEHFDLVGKIKEDAIIIGANGQAIASVANDKASIAYVSYSAAIAAVHQNQGIKILSLDGIEGSPENVLNDSYALTRSLNLVYLEKNSELVSKLQKIFKLPEAAEVFKKNSVMPSII